MEHQIVKAEIRDGGLWLKVKNIAKAMQEVYQMLPDKAYVANIGPEKRKRSLDANAYFWTLVGKLAQTTGVGKTEIYRHMVREIGGNTQVLGIPRDGVETFCKNWSDNGLGWVTDVIGDSPDGRIDVIVYYGSSTYDTAQMSRLIDLTIQECQQLGIEHLPPHEIEKMLRRWGNKKSNKEVSHQR